VTGEGLEPSTNGLTYRGDSVYVIHDTRRQGATEDAKTPSFQAVLTPSESKRSIPCSRTDATENDAERPPVTPQITPSHRVVVPEALPADLQFILDAWADLPEAIKAGLLAMVRAARSVPPNSAAEAKISP
jgi:hypothetical protein